MQAASPWQPPTDTSVPAPADSRYAFAVLLLGNAAVLRLIRRRLALVHVRRTEGADR